MSAPVSRVFIVNPKSAAGRTLRTFERVRPRLAQALGAFDVKLTERPFHASELAREALRAGADVVVAVGGDGTVNEVVNGFFDESGSLVSENAALGVMVSGTGGDFRRTFGWSEDPEDAIARIAAGKTRSVDVGRASYTTAGGEAHRYFINIGSFGLSGAVDEVVNRTTKAFGAKASFVAGTVRAFVSFKAPKVRISLDGGAPFDERISLVAVANGQFFGGGMWIAPEARVDDAAFDVVRVREASAAYWLKNGVRVYQGKHLGLDIVSSSRATSVVAEPSQASERVLIDLDGEQVGWLPARFDLAKGRVNLIV